MYCIWCNNLLLPYDKRVRVGKDDNDVFMHDHCHKRFVYIEEHVLCLLRPSTPESF